MMNMIKYFVVFMSFNRLWLSLEIRLHWQSSCIGWRNCV